jgi:glycosyltransferase involved in cell wall biosynthesis
MSAKISAIIPTYNAGAFLAETLRSVLGQTRPADEIIVVDDCSTDDSLAVAKSFNDPRFKILSTGGNSGSAVARNLGIEAATGELIAFLDGDDLWLDRHLEIVAGLLEAHPTASLAFSSTEAFGSEQWTWPMVLPANQPVNCFWECIPRTIIPQMNVVVRAAALRDIGGYRTTLRQTQDFDLFLRLSYRHPFVCTHAVTSRYRRHATSITWLKPRNSIRGQYVARHLFWSENKSSMPPEILRKYELAMKEVWVNHLAACANRLDFDMLNFHVEQFLLIPGAEEPYRNWRRQRRIDRVKRLGKALPRPLRQALKRIWGSAGFRAAPLHVVHREDASRHTLPAASLRYDDDVSI